MQVASVGHDGAPHLTTLFYVVRDGRIAFWTYGRSQKIRNLERDPRVSCLVEDGVDYFELRGVSITGTRRDRPRPRRGSSRSASEVATRMVGAESFEALGDFGRRDRREAGPEAGRRDRPPRPGRHLGPPKMV